jgi:hypothetical protein
MENREGHVVAFVLMLNDSPLSVTLDEDAAKRRIKKLKKEWEEEQARMCGLERFQSFRHYHIEEVPFEEKP